MDAFPVSQEVRIQQVRKDVLVVVPYRDRDEDLQRFLANAPAFFATQAWTCDILLCEMQRGPDWNAGVTCNSLGVFLRDHTIATYTHVYIHHVDIFPTGGVLPLPPKDTCYMNLGDYGSCLLTLAAFANVGGYSNKFWGWGGEDNHLYEKLRGNSIAVLDATKCPEVTVQFNVEKQNHERKFNGLNYGNGINIIYNHAHDRGYQGIHNHITVLNGATWKGATGVINIWHQLVHVHLVCPTQSPNSTVLLGYIKDADIVNIRPWLKSASIYAAYQYDIALIVAGGIPEAVINELLAYNVTVYRHTPTVNNIFIDRFQAYVDFIKTTPYQHILHTDVTDAYFQQNPVPVGTLGADLVFTSECITVQEQEWNRKTVHDLYSSRADISTTLKQEVLCGGVFGGGRLAFIKFCEAIVDEYTCLFSMYPDWVGIDQGIIQQLAASGRFPHKVDSHGIAIHLHTHFSGEYGSRRGEIVIEQNRKVKVVLDIKHDLRAMDNSVPTANIEHRPAIVHQYNRNPAMKKEVVEHFTKYFAPV